MQKLFKSKLFVFILGVTSVIGITSVFAISYSIIANDVGFTPKDNSWEVENTKEALDDLHNKINSMAFRRVCTYANNDYSQDKSDLYAVGTQYECDPGDGILRNFYILNVNGEVIKLIMQHNLTEKTSKKVMTWMDAKSYIDDNNIKVLWNNVIDVDLPKANDIALAVGKTNWKATTATVNDIFCLKSKVYDNVSGARCKKDTDYCWLHDYLYFDQEYHCPNELTSDEAYGYWTSDYINTSTSSQYAWRIHSSGSLSNLEITTNKYMGVRPTITVFKTNLY
ncbi:MAG: hypothetical protein IJ572_00890 [Bacilli bacterium]|nr:hypothetical protein [Bacilli bacterium]